MGAAKGAQMMVLDAREFARVRHWIYRNARPVDLARWRYHFHSGAREDVLCALAAYQNADGGMGHALEADSWNPNSTPMQCSTAIDILREIDWHETEHPLVRNLLRYLDSGAEFVAGRWLNVVPSNNDYPHAPWWHTDSTSTSHSEYNPTAILAGFILEYADRESALYQRGITIAQELLTSFACEPHLAMHPLLCVAHLLRSIGRAGLQNALDLEQLTLLADEQAGKSIRQDADGWDGYTFRPSHWIKSPASALYNQNKALVERELDYLLSHRNAAGIWDITWRWESYPDEFAISANWWQADIAIKNVLLLDAFDRVER
jgi:hypothetical protein